MSPYDQRRYEIFKARHNAHWHLFRVRHNPPVHRITLPKKYLAIAHGFSPLISVYPSDGTAEARKAVDELLAKPLRVGPSFEIHTPHWERWRTYVRLDLP